MNCFLWFKNDTYWIISGDLYNKELKNWLGPIHNGPFHPQTLNEKRKTEEICTNYSGSSKFNGIPRELNPEIRINSYKDQFREHIIRNMMGGVLYLTEPWNQDKKQDILLH